MEGIHPAVSEINRYLAYHVSLFATVPCLRLLAERPAHGAQIAGHHRRIFERFHTRADARLADTKCLGPHAENSDARRRR